MNNAQRLAAAQSFADALCAATGSVGVTVTDGPVTAVAYQPRHVALAQAWARWNSASGRATPKQTARILKQLPADVLERMLRERGVEVA